MFYGPSHGRVQYKVAINMYPGNTGNVGLTMTNKSWLTMIQVSNSQVTYTYTLLGWSKTYSGSSGHLPPDTLSKTTILNFRLNFPLRVNTTSLAGGGAGRYLKGWPTDTWRYSPGFVLATGFTRLMPKLQKHRNIVKS